MGTFDSHVFVLDSTESAEHSDLLSTSSHSKVNQHWLCHLLTSILPDESLELVKGLGELRVMGHDFLVPFLQVWIYA